MAQQTTKAIAYYRVSTDKQGESGLGLESQEAQVQAYAMRAGLELVNSYTEVETGTNKKTRPQFELAKRECLTNDAILLIAKLDRLARNVNFITGLREEKLNFVAVDMPEANTLTINIMASMAEHEAELISQRTKAGLQAAKARGQELGKPENFTEQGRAKGRATVSNNAKAKNELATGYAVDVYTPEMSLRELCQKMNDRGFRTATGKEFQAVQVKRLLNRAGIDTSKK